MNKLLFQFFDFETENEKIVFANIKIKTNK